LTLWSPPAGRTSWCLEVGPGLIEISRCWRRCTGGCRLFALRLRSPIFLHIQILIYGGYYTYALTPLGNWAKDHFHLARNHYDRIGHLALGVVPSMFDARESCCAARH